MRTRNVPGATADAYPKNITAPLESGLLPAIPEAVVHPLPEVLAEVKPEARVASTGRL